MMPLKKACNKKKKVDYLVKMLKNGGWFFVHYMYCNFDHNIVQLNYRLTR